MNLIYREIGTALAEGALKGYKRGVADVVKLTKKEILRLSDTPLNPLSRGEFTFGDIFKASYTDVDKQLIQNFQVEAFTVAGVHQYEAQEKLKQIAIELMNGTHPLLKNNPEKSIEKLFHAEAYNILAYYIEVPDAPPPSVLTTNLRTAVNSAYHGAQWQKLQDVKDVFPSYQYKTRDDAKVRDEHRVLHDKIFSANDPVWKTIYPPNGWNCRCYVNPLSAEELQSAGEREKVNIADEPMRKQLIKEANIEKDFQRNSGDAKSIWGKWLDKKLKEVDLSAVEKQLRDYADTKLAAARKDKIFMDVDHYAESHVDEAWGKFVKRGVTHMMFLKYRENGFEYESFDAAQDDGKSGFESYERIDEYRKGVLMNIPLSPLSKGE